MLLLVAGCATRETAAAVDPARARQTLVRVLDGWKDGRKIESFRAETPEVVVQDMDWKRGCALVDYEMLGEGQAVDANLNCDVRLTIRDPQGKESDKTVRYIVGTDPVLTVFREIM